ncbi:MAG: AarF/ABC1/UbiB kinase family protein [Alphaproteobacteria bacterium]|nr:AarF/ABC1/UbiB kinase family protein [Alphaproteobacteria bacterium]
MADPLDALPRGLRSRLRHAGRVAGAAAAFGAQRLVRTLGADEERFGERLVAELDTLKGMAMKVGQILSYMDGALPAGTQAALGRLQRGVQPLAWPAIAVALEEGLGRPVDEVFASVDPEAVAAASIGQVHRGVLHDGRAVAVKVQYPGVRETFEADVRQLRGLAGVAGMATMVDGQAIVDDLAARLREECDYRHEARWQRAFARAWAHDAELVIPEVIDAASSDTVLTTVWCAGSSLEDFGREGSDEGRQRAARVLARFAWRSLFGLGTLHADPHPGNQIFREDGVVMLDFGCVRAFPEAWLDATRRELRALQADDEAAFREAVIDAGMVPDPDRFDFASHYAMQRFVWGPWCAPRWRFEAGWLAGIQQWSGPQNPNLRRLAIPPQWIWLQREVWGLNAVLVRLGAEGDFRSVLEAALDLPLERLEA